ncbi:MAG: aminotransferase class V-fold PLP-dependent enzyme [Ardenticatenaceae bacterium]|nr:aminotransferase class V-fold PLP-dependent enzyme [Ardenticatenaceae bacterium]
MMTDLKELFLLDPKIIFLNHGSFGATPRPVFADYQAWQRRLEHQPVYFLVEELTGHLAAARQALGDYLHAPADDLVYVPNATFALNIVARSLDLRAGDEVLTTDHEYGACDNTWQFLSQKKGFAYVRQPIPVPVVSATAVAEQFWHGVTPRTKVIFLSHITSSTALTFPVAEVCRRARAAGILTIIDGAHAPGQVPLDMAVIDADFYFGNAHKWLCSPKGAAFLYARRDKQPLLEPLVVGWGWGENRPWTYGSNFLDDQQWLGTNDLSAYLAVPAAIAFQAEHDWTAVRQQCHLLLRDTMQRIGVLTGLLPIYPDDAGFYHQMATIPLPQLTDLKGLKTHLYQQYRVEVPLVEWQNRHFIRVSIQGYNTSHDADALLAALAQALPQFAAG